MLFNLLFLTGVATATILECAQPVATDTPSVTMGVFNSSTCDGEPAITVAFPINQEDQCFCGTAGLSVSNIVCAEDGALNFDLTPSNDGCDSENSYSLAPTATCAPMGPTDWFMKNMDASACATSTAGGDVENGGLPSEQPVLSDEPSNQESTSTQEGESTTVEGEFTTVEGESTTAEGESTVEGESTTVEGESATAEGDSTTASATESTTTEGESTTLEGEATTTVEGESTEESTTTMESTEESTTTMEPQNSEAPEDETTTAPPASNNEAPEDETTTAPPASNNEAPEENTASRAAIFGFPSLFLLAARALA